MAGADLWVNNDEKFCVLIFYQVASIFHLRVGGIKIVWANLLTTMIYQGDFTIKGNSLLFGNVLATFFGGVGGGSKFSEAIFNITRPVRLLSYPHFFCQGQNPAPFLAMPVFSLLLKVLVLHQPFQ